MSFEAPALLVFLLAVPAAVAGYVWLEQHRAERAAAWTAPALAPNLVPNVPGWRRHLPVALLLAGVTLLLVGFARPKATITVKRHQATVVLVIDQSGSMASKDVRPTRLGAARAAAEKLVATVPKSYEIAVITFSDHAALVAPPTLDRKVVLAALERTRSGPQGTALTEAVSRAVAVADSVPGAKPHESPPAVVLVFSDGAQTARGLTPTQVGQAAAKAHIPVSAVAVGTPDGVVDQRITGGYTEQIAVPVSSDTLRAIAQAAHGRVVTTFDPTFLRNVVDGLGSRVGHERKGVEVTSAAAGAGMALMLVGAFLGGVWFRRVPVRAFLAALFVALAVVVVWPAAGGATNECKDIPDCIRVPGPWVMTVPGRESQYLLSCPKGLGIVAGLDSQATSNDVRVRFDGQLGSPVSPGVTTARSALFHALTLGKRRETFQPLIGCVRAVGGTGRSTVSARPAAPKPVPAGPPLDPHAQTVVVRPGLVRSASVRCPAGEQLAGSWDSLAFRTTDPPDLAQTKNVQVHRAVVKGKAVVTVLATDALSPDAHAVVQVGVECAP